jgi:hypothetical protein
MHEQSETLEQSVENTANQPRPDERNDVLAISHPASYPQGRSNTPVSPQMGGGGCGCSGARMTQRPDGRESMAMNGMNAFVYAIGRVEARFPNLAAEKEFAQATGRADTAGKTDQQAFHEVLSQRQNRYLVRQLCWVLTVQGLETYLLQPRDPADLDMLVDAIRPAPAPQDIVHLMQRRTILCVLDCSACEPGDPFCECRVICPPRIDGGGGGGGGDGGDDCFGDCKDMGLSDLVCEQMCPVS